MSDYVQANEENFAEWLCNICETYEITASSLSREIHVNRSTISLWKSGQRLPSCAPGTTCRASRRAGDRLLQPLDTRDPLESPRVRVEE